MKSQRNSWLRLGALIELLLLLGFTTGVFAQYPPPSNTVPVVTIRATDPFANRLTGDTGTFTVFRDGSTNQPLHIFYRIGGTASNGLDYAAIGNYVDIAAGARSNNIVITPINSGQTDLFQTVVLQLAPPPTLPPVNFMIGRPDTAVVYIARGTNIPPGVHISTPPNGSTFVAPANIPICADAGDIDGYVATVEFFAGNTSIGVRTNNPLGAGPANPFCLVWTNVPAGEYVLTAKATDNGGASTTSDPITVKVVTNLPPIVRIASPPDHTTFRAPVNIPIFAFAFDPFGMVASVEFFAGSNSLGLGRPITANPPHTNSTPGDWGTNYWFLTWSNAPLGEFALTAKATDNQGASTVSDPVHVNIVQGTPPDTNRPPIVTIVATDPIAIEGTNCWPWWGVTNSHPGWSNWPPTGVGWRFFTNCGPKNAAFTVRRSGVTNDPLTVTYAIGGSATNGVDYVTLSGIVSIPAGQRQAQVSVVPIDDGPPDLTSTVILKLLPSTNSPPVYKLGDSRSAAAIILDGGGPRLVTGLLGDRSFHFNASGPDGAWFRIEFTTDMATWTPISESQVIQGAIDFIDPDASGNPQRFYRAVPENGPSLY
jgi:hypothetical protein